MGKLFLKEPEIKQLLAVADGNPRDYAMLELMASTGMRISDTIRLRRQDMIDSDGKIVRSLRVKMRKTGKYVERELREDARSAIALYLSQRRDRNPYVFICEANTKFPTKHLTRQSAHRIFKRILLEVFPRSRLHRVSTHVLRRSVGQLIALRTGRVETAMTFLGHTDSKSTMDYLDLDHFSDRANATLHSLSW